MFADRSDAAQRLARALEHYTGRNPLVLGIPRGAVPMARDIARALGGEVDVVLVRKLRAPGQREFAIGAIDESGWSYLNPEASFVHASSDYLQAEKEEQLATMHARRRAYTAQRAPIDPAGRIVIVVDDGLATGSTMIAALHALREKKPAKLVCAVPVAPPDTLERVRPLCDELVCLESQRDFWAVSQFYASFPQVDDDEVVAALAGR
jgi:predicted phosphoribosyltransferase